MPNVMRRPATAPLIWALAAVAAVVTVAAVAGALAVAAASGEWGYLLSHLSVSPLVALAFLALGGLVTSRQPRNGIGWIFLVVGYLYTATLAADVYVDLSSLRPAGASLPGAAVAAWLGAWIWIPGILLPTAFLFLLFPTGRPPTGRWRPVLWANLLGLALTVVAVALHPGPLESWGLSGSNPLAVPRAAAVLEPLVAAGQVLLAAGFVGGIAAFAVRFRRARGAQREQMKWVLYAVALMALLIAATAIAWFAWPESALVAELSIAATSLSILGIAAGATVAILRYRLYEIDLVVNRTLVYLALTVSVVAFYVLVVGGLSTLFQTQGNMVVALVATGAVAVIFQPLRARIQRVVNHLFYGGRDDPLGTLSRLGQRLEVAMDPEVVLPTLVETIAHSLKLPYVAIALRSGDRLQIAAQSGEPVAAALHLPLIYQGDTVGELRAGPRAPDEAFNGHDRRLLEQIARQAAPAVDAIQLTIALRHARQQLVTTREEERRRLRRDLHDGLGASLAALHLQTGVLRRAIRTDPAHAEAVVDDVRADIRATIEEIRRLVHELRPPTLDQLGLAAAVRAQASACSRAAARAPEVGAKPALQVTVDAPAELPPLPAAVEVAAYRIAQEALTNVLRHADARRCTVRLAVDDGLTVEVVDDGVGVTKSRRQEKRAGVGLLSMRERALELGGTCIVEPAAGGGTRIRASLPLPREAQHAPEGAL
ncbi:MAG: histidine kinase [Candidatus Promineifilaceae bacterium]|nr:histidine kinase [Candidatus Promineifilaceae bacterium]